MATASGQQEKLIELAILSTQKLRASVSRGFQHLHDGIGSVEESDDRTKVSEESEEIREKRMKDAAMKAFITKLQENLSTISDNYNELERMCGSLAKIGDKAQLHNSGFLSLDPTTDKTPIYLQTLQSYKWSAKMHAHAGHALSMLQHTWSLKRSSGVASISSKKRKQQPASHSLQPHMVNMMIINLDRQNPDISITKVQPYSNVYQVTLGRTLQVILVLRSLLIERVIVRAHHEHILKDDGTLDIWSKSRYEVFQKITDHATSAMLHYDLNLMPELSIRSFMKWLHSYLNFFSTPCRRCGKYLKDNLPPTWREFLSLDPYHESCRL